MIEVRIESRELDAALDKLSRSCADMSPAMHQIGMELETRISARFETETDPDGKRWAEHKPGTVNSYPRHGNGRILDRTQEMLRSLSYQADSHSVTVGFGKPYALYHEFGTRKMARRGLIFSIPDTGTLSNEDEQTVLSVVNDYLRRAIGK